ncbi:MAG TPA: immunoglobulin domain-containing protein [Thermomicrobiales bacterium]|nr:immunoglobulin domain-containing protein [Thermomicrobiales bacterium]
MPSPAQDFAGLSFSGSCTGGQCGSGYPPDPNGDVGPNNYVQAVNTSIGIFGKTGAQEAAFTFDSLWSGANTGTACDTSNQGDPVVLYDPLADRFIFMDFAWTDLTTGPYYFCFAVAQTSDPTGSYWLYAIRGDDATHPWLPDYPKGGVWPDGLYFSANMFCMQATGCTGGQGSFQEVRVWAFDRQEMEAGATLQSVVGDTGSTAYFTLLPGNLRGTPPPAGTPDYFVSEDEAGFFFDVFALHPVYGGAGSTFTGPTRVAQDAYTTPNGAIVPQPGTTTELDTIGDRLMMQNQYRDIGGTESLWVAHTVQAAASPTTTGVQWAQIDVTGGAIGTTPVQQQEYFPDTTLYRWLPSLAVDRDGNMAVGYSVSSASTYPSIRYAGRFATDPLNTLPQGETTLIAGGGSQSLTCGGNPCDRWGDYSAMTVDPVDDCTFWYTNEYYTATGGDWQTRIGSFRFPSCGAPVVTANPTDQVVTAGQTVTFTAAASGSPAPTVQWQVRADGGGTFANIPGQTSTTLTFTATASENGNQYRAVFTNTAGSAATTAATLTVDAPPAVTINPASQTVTAGDPVSFTAAASGSPPPAVQWQVSADTGLTFANIPGATGPTLTFTTAASENGNQYRAVFSNAAGTATTAVATLTVDFPPAVTTQPTNQTVTAGQAATFNAAAGGNPAPTVQWQVSVDGGATFAAINGATSTTLTFTATTGQNGDQYRAVFTNAIGLAMSNTATLTVVVPPPVWTPWASQGGILTDSPAAASLGSRVYVFAKGSDSALYVKSGDAAGNFTGWRSLGGVLTAAPAAASFNGRLYAFAKGTDNALYVTSSADGVNWTGWSSQGGILLAPPAAASATGRLFVFAMGPDKALYVKSTADGVNWTNWQSLGGILTAAPAAVGFQGRVYAFAKGSDNALYVKSSADGVNWTDWSDLGGILVAAPAAATSGDGTTLYTFASGTGGFAYERHSPDGATWTQWQSLGGAVVGPPAAASIANGPLFVFVRWTDNALWERRLTP